MRLLRRAAKPDDAASDSAAAPAVDPRRTASKGRPTPKQPRRGGPVAPPPRTRREAYKRMRDRSPSTRDEVRRGMRAGDDRYLAPRDAGAARALARDAVDSRRNIGGIFLFVAIIVLVSYAIPNPTVRGYITYLWLASFLAIIVDSFFLTARVRKLVGERLPEDATRGLGWYSVQRSTMIRRFRTPRPQVEVGDQI